MQYDDFYEIKEIGSGGYGTVYTAKYKHKEYLRRSPELVVLKKFKNNIDNKIELFIYEVSIHT
jgi:serine/threonine protein kinase